MGGGYHIQRKDIHTMRINFLIVPFFIFGMLVVGKLFILQVIKSEKYEDRAMLQRLVNRDLIPARGEIFLRDKEHGGQLQPLATNKEFDVIYAVPEEVDNPYVTATVLADKLGFDSSGKEALIAKLSKENDKYEHIARKIDKNIVEDVKKLNLKGIYIGKETGRYYPNNSFASAILGFVGWKDKERVGMYGLEGYNNDALAGIKGHVTAEYDGRGNVIGVAKNEIEQAVNGESFVLTIDKFIQEMSCKSLKEAVEANSAENGAVIIMDPKTGAIRAMCSYPDFDPNNYAEVSDASAYNNITIHNAYEPGSVFKPITMSIALNEKKITPTTTYNDTGVFEIEEYKIKNSDGLGHGIQTMTEVLEKSLNTGAIFAAQQVDRKKFREYIENFGFGSLTGIPLNTEASGNIKSLGKNHFLYTATASFGQGITVTPLQLVAAFGVLANGGALMKPYIIEETLHNDLTSTKTEPEVVRQILSPETATTVSAMMVSVIKSGYGKRAGVEGYNIAGKTGTAQITNPYTGKYYENQFNHTFVGFGPVENPRFVMVTYLSKPKNGKFAESTAAPLFGTIAKQLFQYYQISY